MLYERAIQGGRENSQESKVIRRNDQISLAGKMTVTLKANKSRETQPQRPRSPSISSGDASNCSAVQVNSADFYRGTRIFDDLSFDTTKLHSIAHDTVSKLPSRIELTNRRKEESISPSTKFVNNRSSTGFNRTQNKTHQS
jgi:hypothetical protein